MIQHRARFVSSFKNLPKLFVAFFLGAVCSFPFYFFPKGYVAEFLILMPSDGGEIGYLYENQGLMWELTSDGKKGVFNRYGLNECSGERSLFAGPPISTRLEDRYRRVIRVAITQREKSLALDCGEKVIKVLLEKVALQKQERLAELENMNIFDIGKFASEQQEMEASADFTRTYKAHIGGLTAIQLFHARYQLEKSKITLLGKEVADLRSNRNFLRIFLTGGFLGILAWAVVLAFREFFFSSPHQSDKR